MSDSLPIDSVSAPPSAASPTDLHHRTRLGTQYNDACPPVNSRVAGGADETRADPGSSSGGGGGGAAWTPFRRDLVVLGAAFLALFAAYSAIQNLETSLHPRAGMGAVSLAVIYGGIVVFAPLAPAVIRYLRPRGAMLDTLAADLPPPCDVACLLTPTLSALPPPLLPHASPSARSWVLLLSAGYLGASASVLWVAQGLYSVMLARGHAAAAGVAEQAAIAEFSGIFWGMFAANQVVGNAVAFLVCRLMALLFPPAPAALATPAAPSPQSLPPTTVTVLIVTFLLFLALAAALTWRLTDLSEDHPLCCPSPAPLVDGVAVREGIGGTTGEDEEEGDERGDERGDEGEGKALLGSEVVAGRPEEWGAVEQSGPAGGVGEGAGKRAKGGRSAWELLGERRLQLLLPLLLYIGLQSAFVACVPAMPCHTLSRPATSVLATPPLPNPGFFFASHVTCSSRPITRCHIAHPPPMLPSPHPVSPGPQSIRADFTLYVVRPALGVAWIGGVMSVFGVANSLVSWALCCLLLCPPAVSSLLRSVCFLPYMESGPQAAEVLTAHTPSFLPPIPSPALRPAQACMAAARLSSGLHSILATLLVGAACQIAVLLSLLLFTPLSVPVYATPSYTILPKPYCVTKNLSTHHHLMSSTSVLCHVLQWLLLNCGVPHLPATPILNCDLFLPFAHMPFALVPTSPLSPLNPFPPFFSSLLQHRPLMGGIHGGVAAGSAVGGGGCCLPVADQRTAATRLPSRHGGWTPHPHPSPTAFFNNHTTHASIHP
ncbi:unnamed protein product [Closterium sp. NIES-54]